MNVLLISECAAAFCGVMAFAHLVLAFNNFARAVEDRRARREAESRREQREGLTMHGDVRAADPDTLHRPGGRTMSDGKGGVR